LTREMIGRICLQMADPEGGVILHLGDERARAAAPFSGFHNEFLVLQRLR